MSILRTVSALPKKCNLSKLTILLSIWPGFVPVGVKCALQVGGITGSDSSHRLDKVLLKSTHRSRVEGLGKGDPPIAGNK